MEGEIQRFIMVWALAVSSLCYCHIIGKTIAKGFFRFLLILPIIFLFFLLPLFLSAIFFVGPTSFFLAWLANFNLLLFAFGQGPLSSGSGSNSSSTHSMLMFVSLACLPIKIQHNKQSHEKVQKVLTSPLNYATKILILSTFVPFYPRKEKIHPHLMMLLYSVYLYIALELFLLAFSCLTRACLRLEIEPQFNEPYLATSLQDFWGKRWNLLVSGILRPTVYNPVRATFNRLIGRKWAPLPAVLSVFLVSGIMHEVIFYYLERTKPTWELMWFFTLHGVCVVIEIVVKKAVNDRGRLPRAVSGPLTVSFVAATSLWFFMPHILSSEVDVKALREITTLINFMKEIAEKLSGAIAQPRMLVPAVLVMFYNRWNGKALILCSYYGILVPNYGFMHLELIPMLVGFFTYRSRYLQFLKITNSKMSFDMPVGIFKLYLA